MEEQTFEHLPKAAYRGVLPINGVEIPCFVLNDGRRVISGRGMTSAIGMKGRGQGFQRIPVHRTISPFISNDLRLAIENPIIFRGSGSRKSRPTAGFEATVLVELCESVLNARDAGALRTEQDHRYAEFADTLMRAFAKVGIIALVDEATGYQADRDQEELQKILAAYISPELLRWTRRFPPEFYKEMFRLRGWQYMPLSTQRPKMVGKLTNELIYEKLPPGVLDTLRKLEPKDEKGNRKNKFHQHLTPGVGEKHLDNQIAVVVTLMRISPNWRAFERHFKRAFPEAGHQYELGLENEDE